MSYREICTRGDQTDFEIEDHPLNPEIKLGFHHPRNKERRKRKGRERREEKK